MQPEYQNISCQSDIHERERQRARLSTSFRYRPLEVVLRKGFQGWALRWDRSKKTNTPKHFSLVAVSQQGIWYKFLLAEPMLFNPAYFMLATIICRPHLQILNLEVFPFCLTKISQKQVSFTATLTDVFRCKYFFSNVKYDESVSEGVFALKHFCLHWPPTVCTIKYRQKNIMSLISIDRLEKIKALCFISAR